MSHFHAVIWVDHREAHVISFNPDEAESVLVHAKGGHRQVHHRHGSVSGGRAGEDPEFFKRIVEAVRENQEILLTGPAAAKMHLYAWWQKHEPAAARRIVGIESADHPTDGQLLKHARAYFDAKDRMRPQV